jgi:hypothetical protein
MLNSRRKNPSPIEPLELQKAILDQDAICNWYDKLLQGYIAQSCDKAIQAIGSADKHIPSAIHSFLVSVLIWDTLFQRMWDTRYHILHHQPNNYKIVEQGQSLDQRLRWYNNNCNLHQGIA